MGRWPLAIVIVVLSLFLDRPFGYGETPLPPSTTITIYPVTTGLSHHPMQPIARVMIVGTHAGVSMASAIAAAKDVFQRGGMTIVEKAFPQSLTARHGPHAGEGMTADAALLAVGKEAGADHLILLDVTDTLVLEESGTALVGYLHDERVTVRGFGVESGALVLEGTTRWSQPVERPGQHIRQLTAYAIARALCPSDKWEEASAVNDGRGRCRR